MNTIKTMKKLTLELQTLLLLKDGEVIFYLVSSQCSDGANSSVSTDLIGQAMVQANRITK
jgi:hypothetical protein